MYATLETFSLSATNSSKSAYCRFKYEKQFFSKYSICEPHQVGMVRHADETATVTGQMLIKVIHIISVNVGCL